MSVLLLLAGTISCLDRIAAEEISSTQHDDVTCTSGQLRGGGWQSRVRQTGRLVESSEPNKEGGRRQEHPSQIRQI